MRRRRLEHGSAEDIQLDTRSRSSADGLAAALASRWLEVVGDMDAPLFGVWNAAAAALTGTGIVDSLATARR
jgi:hypothetical protein